MEKECFIVRKYYIENYEEHTKSITLYLNEEYMQEGCFSWKYDFATMNTANTDLRKALQGFYKSLAELQYLGYKITFIEKEIEK